MIETVAAAIIVATGAAGILAAATKARPVRWLGRTIVADPFRRWFRREVAEVVDERLDARPLTNGRGERIIMKIAEKVGVDPDDLP